MNKLEEFLHRGNAFPRNQWLRLGHMSVYLRRSFRYINDTKVTVTDIASVAVDERWQGKGLFKEFLVTLNQLSTADYIFVENVLTEGFRAYFLRNGWTKVDEDTCTEVCSFYKKVRAT